MLHLPLPEAYLYWMVTLYTFVTCPTDMLPLLPTASAAEGRSLLTYLGLRTEDSNKRTVFHLPNATHRLLTEVYVIASNVK